MEPFDSDALHTASRSWDRIEAVTADFLLSVFNANEWKCNLQSTIGAWDAEHRAAFVAWVHNPFWG